jgi:hypothetical protein
MSRRPTRRSWRRCWHSSSRTQAAGPCHAALPRGGFRASPGGDVQFRRLVWPRRPGRRHGDLRVAPAVSYSESCHTSAGLLPDGRWARFRARYRLRCCRIGAAAGTLPNTSRAAAGSALRPASAARWNGDSRSLARAPRRDRDRAGVKCHVESPQWCGRYSTRAGRGSAGGRRTVGQDSRSSGRATVGRRAGAGSGSCRRPRLTSRGERQPRPSSREEPPASREEWPKSCGEQRRSRRRLRPRLRAEQPGSCVPRRPRPPRRTTNRRPAPEGRAATPGSRVRG